MVVTLNGPAASGKGTIAKALAIKIGVFYYDIGLLFRLASFLLIKKEIPDFSSLELFFQSRAFYSWDGDRPAVFLDNSDITDLLQSPDISQKTSEVFSMPDNFWRLNEFANNILAGRESLVCDGRNAGTTILPEADYKFYITASLETRARRRLQDFIDRGHDITFEEVSRNIQERDRLDRERELGPLIVPEEAKIIDTTFLSVPESVSRILLVVGFV